MEPQFIPAAGFNALLARMALSAEVFVPKTSGEKTSWQRLAPGGEYHPTAVRVDHPAKGFFFPAQEGVGRYPASAPAEPSAPRRVLVGVKACDLVALKTYDAVFGGGEVKDDFYLAKRANTLLVAADCPQPAPTCGCALLGGKPWPEEGYDLAISPVDGGFVVEAGSDKGRAVLEENRGAFAPAGSGQIEKRQALRRSAEAGLKEINAAHVTSAGRQELVRRQDRAGRWQESVSTCVECGACLFACPTCYCFVLHDYPAEGGGGVRAKAWDACIYGGYHLMAGGGSPRADLIKRFRNRWLHKFDYFVDQFGFESCSGCGRCIAGCPGKIDLRQVIKSMEGG